jgi:hypothetical protein
LKNLDAEPVYFYFYLVLNLVLVNLDFVVIALLCVLLAARPKFSRADIQFKHPRSAQRIIATDCHMITLHRERHWCYRCGLPILDMRKVEKSNWPSAFGGMMLRKEEFAVLIIHDSLYIIYVHILPSLQAINT